jgi:hypothetical protein
MPCLSRGSDTASRRAVRQRAQTRSPPAPVDREPAIRDKMLADRQVASLGWCTVTAETARPADAARPAVEGMVYLLAVALGFVSVFALTAR